MALRQFHQSTTTNFGLKKTFGTTLLARFVEPIWTAKREIEAMRTVSSCTVSTNSEHVLACFNSLVRLSSIAG